MHYIPTMFVVHGGKRSNKRVCTIIKTSRDPLVKCIYIYIYVNTYGGIYIII